MLNLPILKHDICNCLIIYEKLQKQFSEIQNNGHNCVYIHVYIYFLSLFILRERETECASGEGAERERKRRVLSRFLTVSADHDVGLHLVNYETSAEISSQMLK